ncbi:hypothetical protein Tco_1095589 [Tanacetum coccineum]
MVTYLKHMGKYTHNQLKTKSLEEIQKLYEREQKWIKDFVPMDSKVVGSSAKKGVGSRKKTLARKRAGGKDSEEKDDSAVNIESLETKYPIVDWQTQILGSINGEDIVTYQIKRADGSAKYYKIFSAMLSDFDKQDVLDLYRLVKQRFETSSPEGYDRLLWGDLITMIEPNEEDEVWRNQQDWNLISWKLYDSCGVHVLLMDTGFVIHMLIEKKYPLSKDVLTRMLNWRLEADFESEMAYELIRFIRSQLKE